MPSEMTMPTDLDLPDLDLNGPLWQFSGRFWSSQAGQDACLALQTQGWSVTDILCALWLGSQGLRFSGLADEQTLLWRSQVTERLRQVRKTIRKDNPGTNPVRDCVARSELESEKVELALAHRALAATVTEGRQRKGTAKTLALENLQAAAPEKTMDNETGMLLEILIGELPIANLEEHTPC